MMHRYSKHLLILLYFSFCDAWIFSQPTYNFVAYTKNMQISLTGYMTAFSDFNADRMVDIFVLDKSENVQRLDVILMAKEFSTNLPKRITLFTDNNDIRNIMTGDFNGDSYLDVVSCSSTNPMGPYTVEIAYGVHSRNLVEQRTKINMSNFTFKSQPLHMDWNADMIGDIFGQTNTGEFVVLIGNTNKSFTLQNLTYLQPIQTYIDKLLYNYFVDLNQDGQADILLIGLKGKTLTLIRLLKLNSNFIYSESSTPVSQEMEKIGQPVIADFKFDGTLQMLFQFCTDKECRDSRIMTCLLTDLSCKEANFSTSLNGVKMAFDMASNRLTLDVPPIVPMSCGDIKMSGYISCLLMMHSVEKPQISSLVRLHNNGNFQFTLLNLEGNPNLFTNVTQVAVFDLQENGIPDIITVKSQDNSGIILPLLQETSGDSYFIKVMVLNGLCNTIDNCPGNKLPFGIPLPGVMVNYNTEGANGKPQTSKVSLAYDSSFTSLNLPYAFFGLTSFANYIEKLTIQLPYNTVNRQHTLTFVVPKTQIAIIPYPLDEPTKWTNKLFLEPFYDKKVIYVAASLLGTMFLVSIILCILQYLEVREDRLEKMQEAQKFNFDAM